MTLMGICDRCREEKPTHVPHERRRLRHGPDGEHLCARHAREAWDEQLDDEDLVPDGGRAEDGRGTYQVRVAERTSRQWAEVHMTDCPSCGETVSRLMDTRDNTWAASPDSCLNCGEPTPWEQGMDPVFQDQDDGLQDMSEGHNPDTLDGGRRA